MDEQYALEFSKKYNRDRNQPFHNPLAKIDQQIARKIQEEFDREYALALTKTSTDQNINIHSTIDDEQLAREEQFNFDRESLLELAQPNSRNEPVVHAYIPAFNNQTTELESADYEVINKEKLFVSKTLYF
jgi:hypothetical protein